MKNNVMNIIKSFKKKYNQESRGINMIKIAPSILSADFKKLGSEIKEIEEAGADYVHVDVMDGHFVPNITIGPLIVEAIKPITKLPLDVHLMIENPDQYIKDFAEAGADIITVHQETCPHLHRTIQLIKNQNVKAGVVINPATPVAMIKEIIATVDLVLVLRVNPAPRGQSFTSSTLPKTQSIDLIPTDKELDVDLQADVGVTVSTAKE